MTRLHKEILQGAGICRVARPSLAGLGHSELIKQHDLQLLGTSQIHLVPDSFIRVGCSTLSLLEVLLAQDLEDGGINGDPGELHVEKDH